MKNYYSVLHVNSSATFSELKKAYQNLAKLYHPDKLQIADNNASKEPENFKLIVEAWNVLSDDEKRKQYDSLLAQFTLRQCGPIQDEVQIELFEDDIGQSGNLYYLCRCGGLFELTATDLGLQIDYINCNNCSLCIKVIY